MKDSKIKKLDTHVYHLTDDIFYNSTVSPHNPAFCGISDKCLGNGVHNISKCYGGGFISIMFELHIIKNDLINMFLKGVSAFMSLPHFLNAEEKFTQEVKGERLLIFKIEFKIYF